MMRYRDLLALAPRLTDEGFDVLHVHTPFVAHCAGLALGCRLCVFRAIVTGHSVAS